MSKINTNVYYVNGGTVVEELNEDNEGFIYLEKGTEGTYDAESKEFVTEDGENCYVKSKYVDESVECSLELDYEFQNQSE